MALRYLDFDHSEDDAGMGTWDAMASVTPEHLPALLAELEQVLSWAHQEFAGRRRPLDEGGDWDYDLQTLHEGAAPHQLRYDEASGRVTVEPGAPAQTRHTVTLTLCGTAAFAAALRARFSLQ
ncbi:MAG: hypothetical protein R3E55_01485 [Burkholderiaceae bacterium]|nr:hypothetical protein [Burkholderiaceae bacterium]